MVQTLQRGRGNYNYGGLNPVKKLMSFVCSDVVRCVIKVILNLCNVSDRVIHNKIIYRENLFSNQGF